MSGEIIVILNSESTSHFVDIVIHGADEWLEHSLKEDENNLCCVAAAVKFQDITMWY
jgi:hypothetical protein